MESRQSKLELLGTFLEKERDSNFRDATVVGGLDAYLRRWDKELGGLLRKKGSYSILTPPQRQAWADDVLSKLDAFMEPRSAPQPVAPVTQTRQSKRQPSRASTKSAPSLTLDAGIGSAATGYDKRYQKQLERLGVATVEDLIYHFPHRHNDFANLRSVSQLRPGVDQTVLLSVWEAAASESGPGQRGSTQAVLGDNTGMVRVTWFNQGYLAGKLTPGTEVVISGKPDVFRGHIVFKSPELEFTEGQEELIHTGRLVPVYPSTQGLYQRTLRRIVKRALDGAIDDVTEYLPDESLRRIEMLGLRDAIAQMHYPDSAASAKSARRRLAFDEHFMMQLAAGYRRQQWQRPGEGIVLESDADMLRPFLESLPFRLTGAQSRTLWQILDDMRSDKPMSRLVQGDVGSGKTIVAAAALLVAVANGKRGALMAPTELLAEQHFLSITRMLQTGDSGTNDSHIRTVDIPGFQRPVTIGLLRGSMSRRIKDDVHAMASAGAIDIVIGTQALIQQPVDIPDLALVVVDEQHRFGVMQRATLREKGVRPHLLAMSATPIPRSLSLTLYGDLDLSLIDELPPGRQEIETRYVQPSRRADAYRFVRGQIEQGRQAFFVFPLIDESDKKGMEDVPAATKAYEELSTGVFPDLRLALLHGRMPLQEKDDTMRRFKNGDIDILVSTAVIEVGIDVPNATVMVIDGAERFGLAQLHQFRGRVGRGAHKSHCILMSETASQESGKRLKILCDTSDGFRIAEEDLKLRGPGEYVGTRQSGLPELRVASVYDHDIIDIARREALRLIADDPDLSKPEHRPLRTRFQRYVSNSGMETS